MNTIKIHNLGGLPTTPYQALEGIQGDLYDYSGVEALIRSILEKGFIFPKMAWKSGKKLYIIDGHKTKKALELLEERGYEIPEIPYVPIPAKNKKEAALNLVLFNSKFGKVQDPTRFLNDNGIMREDLIALEEILYIPPFDLDRIISPPDPKERGRKLLDEFGAPPFTIFDAKQGYWQERKAAWLGLGIRSELGRGEKLLGFPKQIAEDQGLAATSIFDPVLAELIYTWYLPRLNAKILDPFAGGSVRGIVAYKLGFQYTGIELRQEQIEANYQNLEEIFPEEVADISPTWIPGDSLEELPKIKEKFDLVFTCPPYFDLEQYSEDPKDLSAMSFQEFEGVYREILRASFDKLIDNRFAVVVIGNVRDKKGAFRDLVGLTIDAARSSGLIFYNDCILCTAISSASMRARKFFTAARKQTRIHQNVLIFYKGDPKKIKETFTEVLTLRDE